MTSASHAVRLVLTLTSRLSIPPCQSPRPSPFARLPCVSFFVRPRSGLRRSGVSPYVTAWDDALDMRQRPGRIIMTVWPPAVRAVVSITIASHTDAPDRK